MDAIKHDHAELKDYYHKILDAKDSDTKARWQNQFTWELARHSTGEELVVYPAMERNMGDEGKQMADKDRSEHNKVSCGAGYYASFLHKSGPDTFQASQANMQKKTHRSRNSYTNSKNSHPEIPNSNQRSNPSGAN
jgi:hypothetical protein